jgi:hypothetical protein
MQAPASSQAVAPQMGSFTRHPVLQHWPLPLTSQTSEAQASFSAQPVPSVRRVAQAPFEHQYPSTQSVATRQLVWQLVALAQVRWLGHCAAAWVMQLPSPLQLLVTSVPCEQLDVPQAVLVGGKTQAPASSQSVAPQVISEVSQAAWQQFPLPRAPQIIEVQESFDVHAVPSLSWAAQAPAWQ